MVFLGNISQSLSKSAVELCLCASPALAFVVVLVLRGPKHARRPGIVSLCYYAALGGALLLLYATSRGRFGWASIVASCFVVASGPCFAGLILWLAIEDVRRAPRKKDGPPICAKCGYNLTGNASGVCSECGTGIPGRETRRL